MPLQYFPGGCWGSGLDKAAPTLSQAPRPRMKAARARRAATTPPGPRGPAHCAGQAGGHPLFPCRLAAGSGGGGTVGMGGLKQGGHWGAGQVGEPERSLGVSLGAVGNHGGAFPGGALPSRAQDQEAAGPTSPNCRAFISLYYLFIFLSSPEDMLLDFREGTRERETSVVSYTAQLGTWPTTQACALTGN